jgi:hypothetical protein
MVHGLNTDPQPEAIGAQSRPPWGRVTELRALAKVPVTVRVALLCLVVVGIADALLRHETGLSGDEPSYVRMANHPAGPHTFPDAYRIAIPWLVHVLPFSHVVSFQLLALLAIAASGGALYALLDQFDVEPRVALALVVGFVLSPTLLVVLPRHGQSIDPESTLVMMLGSLFIVRRQKLALAVTILIGATVKETSLFLIPFAYAVWAQRLVDRDALRDAARIAVVPVAAYLVLRTSVEAVGNAYTPGYAGSFLQVRIDVIRQGFAWIELRRLAYTYGPLWFVAPFALRDLRFARRGLVLVALCFISMSFSFDLGRIIFLAAPVFYVATAHVLRGRRRLALVTVIALFALDIGYGVYLQAYGVQHGITRASVAGPSCERSGQLRPFDCPESGM